MGTLTAPMRRLLTEPLLHFLLIGVALFVVYARVDRGAQDQPPKGLGPVHIGAGDVQWLAETWLRQWQRDPTPDELHGLVTEFVKEEVLAREARALGLDDNDTVVRRRLAQKLEFLVQDTARLADPTDDDLRRFYAANPEDFTAEARISFTQVYFSREHRRDAAQDAKAALVQLSRAESRIDAAHLGDQLLMDAEFHDVDEPTVAGEFGRDFARAVFALEPGAWHGPIASGYGLHLVRVSAKRPARQREFAEVRAQVVERWREQRQKEGEEQYFAALLKKYGVQVDDGVKSLVGPLDGPLPEPMPASGEERVG